MSKHTEGPWWLSGDRIKCASGFVAFTTCNPREIDESRADGESWLEMRERTKAARDELAVEVSANARLIAAAPQLLEALQYAIRQVPELGTVPGVRAAIATATQAGDQK